jgi:hypothetical protein
MRNLQSSLIAAIFVATSFLLLAQDGPVQSFERNLRPHVARGGFLSFRQISPPPRKVFHIDGAEYATWMNVDLLESGPDWSPSQNVPVGFAALEEVARQELAKWVTNDLPWSVTSFQLFSTPGNQGLKWYFLVELKPVWEPGPTDSIEKHDSFMVYVDLLGRPGTVGRRVAENQWNVKR